MGTADDRTDADTSDATGNLSDKDLLDFLVLTHHQELRRRDHLFDSSLKLLTFWVLAGSGLIYNWDSRGSEPGQGVFQIAIGITFCWWLVIGVKGWRSLSPTNQQHLQNAKELYRELRDCSKDVRLDSLSEHVAKVAGYNGESNDDRAEHRGKTIERLGCFALWLIVLTAGRVVARSFLEGR